MEINIHMIGVLKMKNKNLWVFGIIILVLCFGAGILIRHSNENEKGYYTYG